MSIAPNERREAMPAVTRPDTPTCAKCGMPIIRDHAGWIHKLPPMPMAERRKYRHVITPREEN
jgi:hypothetical protein